jgi:hypothetical protein
MNLQVDFLSICVKSNLNFKNLHSKFILQGFIFILVYYPNINFLKVMSLI